MHPAIVSLFFCNYTTTADPNIIVFLRQFGAFLIKWIASACGEPTVPCG